MLWLSIGRAIIIVSTCSFILKVIEAPSQATTTHVHHFQYATFSAKNRSSSLHLPSFTCGGGVFMCVYVSVVCLFAYLSVCVALTLSLTHRTFKALSGIITLTRSMVPIFRIRMDLGFTLFMAY